MKNKTRILCDQAEEILRIEFRGIGDRLAYFAEETGEWYWVSQKDLRTALELSRDDNEDIQRNLYSHWCTYTGRRMSERYARTLKA